MDLLLNIHSKGFCSESDTESCPEISQNKDQLTWSVEKVNGCSVPLFLLPFELSDSFRLKKSGVNSLQRCYHQHFGVVAISNGFKCMLIPIKDSKYYEFGAVELDFEGELHQNGSKEGLIVSLKFSDGITKSDTCFLAVECGLIVSMYEIGRKNEWKCTRKKGIKLDENGRKITGIEFFSLEGSSFLAVSSLNQLLIYNIDEEKVLKSVSLKTKPTHIQWIQSQEALHVVCGSEVRRIKLEDEFPSILLDRASSHSFKMGKERMLIISENSISLKSSEVLNQVIAESSTNLPSNSLRSTDFTLTNFGETISGFIDLTNMKKFNGKTEEKTKILMDVYSIEGTNWEENGSFPIDDLFNIDMAAFEVSFHLDAESVYQLKKGGELILGSSTSNVIHVFKLDPFDLVLVRQLHLEEGERPKGISIVEDHLVILAGN
eukprot:TRINITY_DN6642_c0_g1_i2.p1 TRINITY_DN6642_c0_g1~~TRINITY_DN6642_c0_g1_i2.p1  ORF type:complete len:433 (-),score=113.24 TRINITY_DN6642_c0_g1_i2:475-1773(-)